MNTRNIAIAVAVAVLVVGGALFLMQPGSTGPSADGSSDKLDKPVTARPDAKRVVTPGPVAAQPTDPAPTEEPAEAAVALDEVPVYVLPDEPDSVIDPLSFYPLNKQGLDGGFEEMQIEFDACAKEQGVEVPDAFPVEVYVQRQIPPEGYGVEEEMGLVTDVRMPGQDAQAMKPFTDCVQSALHDLLFTAPETGKIRLDLDMEIGR